jgi:hypothetical protein
LHLPTGAHRPHGRGLHGTARAQEGAVPRRSRRAAPRSALLPIRLAGLSSQFEVPATSAPGLRALRRILLASAPTAVGAAQDLPTGTAARRRRRDPDGYRVRTQRAARNGQRATGNGQRATCIMQRATCSMQRAACSVQHNVQSTPRCGRSRVSPRCNRLSVATLSCPSPQRRGASLPARPYPPKCRQVRGGAARLARR